MQFINGKQEKGESVEPVVACRLIDPEFVQRKEQITRELFSHAEQVEEPPDGYRFLFSTDGPWASRSLEFIDAERQCCPFFTFALIFDPLDGPLWLQLRGSAEIKEFVRLELAEALPVGIRKPFQGSSRE
jgi:hypothetical protein